MARIFYAFFVSEIPNIYLRIPNHRIKIIKRYTNGCIGCKMCEKACQFDAVKVLDNVAHIDPEKCTGCGACAAKCPKKVIL